MDKLYTKSISKSYDSKCIIEDININLQENELVSLLGVSGVRKDYYIQHSIWNTFT